MLCVFCEHDASTSRSVEHIIPESLGNKEHVLRRGIVCDGCNNYFASKIEEPILSSIHFQNLRGRQEIPNKRGNIPLQYGSFPRAGIPVAFGVSQREGKSVGAWHEKDDARFVQAVTSRPTGTILVPFSMPVDERLLARFMAKIGVEAYIQTALKAGLGVDEIIAADDLKLIRHFVRRGDRPEKWPMSRRRIYGENAIFPEEPPYQVLHEYSLLVTDESEVYAVICIFGEEFVINLGGPSIDGYRRWLLANHSRSPLYRTSTVGS